MAHNHKQERIFMSNLYIGLMSGTSVDGIDAAVVDFSEAQPKLIAQHYMRYTKELRRSILDLCQPGFDEVNRLGELDRLLGKQFANATTNLLQENKINPTDIRAIGSHGQSIRHHPQKGFTLQIGDPNVIAAETGITTVADFRRRDMAFGGQGAPLVPAFHQAVFSSDTTHRIIVNIGGIANVTLLSADKNHSVLGFDTGPGNTLLDAWAEKHLQQSCDEAGTFAKQGTVQVSLLNEMLNDAFFKLPPPKSTGREYFNLQWLGTFLKNNPKPEDIQATLTDLTAQSIIDAIKPHFNSGEILVCGGGVHNLHLMQRLKELGKHYHIDSTLAFGIHPDWVEAMAFAWLAKQTLAGNPGNLTAVTGAKKTSILGGVYYT
jgi:anhydro-N-acetylmuramic acid kinase